METKAPLARVSQNQSWVLFQKSGAELSRAWAWLRGAKAIVSATGADAASLKAKVEAENGFSREIAPTYVALPTGFDLQVHLRYPGQADRETLTGGLASAYAGGFDSIVS